ncbi:MAG: hypothetical protein ACK4NP_11065 [Parvularculaceae bacterium]
MARLICLLFSAAVAVLATPAAAFGDCSNPDYRGRFDDRYRLLALHCDEVFRTDITTRTLRVPIRILRLRGSTTLSNETATNYLRQLAAKASAALDLLGDVDLARTSILISPLEPPFASADGHRALAGAVGWRAPDECAIIFYKPSGEIDIEYFLLSIAHELFHCVQGKTWPDKAAIYPNGRWWIEGSAVYFSHLVVPDTEQLDFFARGFDELSPETPLIDLSYESVVFFLWLHQKVGPLTGVRRLIDAMPATAGREAQVAALAGAVSLDRWTSFAEDYLDSKIRQPAGRAVPTTPRTSPETVFTGPRTKTTTTRPFLLRRETLTFREGKTYDLKTTASEGGRARMKPFDADWTDPPTEILACDEDQSFITLFLATESDATVTYAVTNTEELERLACCLVGDWKPTAASLRGFARAGLAGGAGAIGAAGGSLSWTYRTGDWTLRFAPDGTGGVFWKNYANEGVVSGPGGSMHETMVTNGDHRFEWRISDRGIGQWRVTDHDVRHHITLRAGPVTISDQIYADPGPSVDSGGFAYQCTDTSLSVTGIYGLNQYQGEHLRAGHGTP